MSSIKGRDVEYKIAPPESMYIIGSNSANDAGELYVIDLNNIASRKNKRNKRLIDLMASTLFLITSPLILLFQKKPLNLFRNIVLVFTGNYSWIGYHETMTISTSQLPKIKKGVLSPLSALRDANLDEATINRLNSLYAKDYHVYTDLRILRKGWRELGG